MSARGQLLSVGIDVGTTTTHLTVSKLELSNQSVFNQAPRLTISKREIVYQSGIHMTPLSADGAIDGNAVAALVRREYEAAGISCDEIQSGAAIITGETARLRNAPEVVHRLADSAGDFVVASAGPHLESILAGRGSGAAAASLETGKTICNIDIGGGTANFAVFYRGEVLDTACLGIGGRFLRLGNDLCLISMTDSGELFLDAVAKSVKVGDRVPEERLELFADLLSETILNAVLCKRAPQVTARLLITDALRHDYDIDEIWLSGGVAELIGSAPANKLAYGDMGGYLAAALKCALAERGVHYRLAKSPIRATVIGAGLHSLQLSGSTVSAGSNSLPLRNTPLIRPFACNIGDPGATAGDLTAFVRVGVERCLLNHDLDWTESPVALVIEKLALINYAGLKSWAAALAVTFKELQGTPPLVIVSSQDMGMALGQLLRQELPEVEVIVVDGISITHGDYIDIGRPVAGGQALPVVIKSLVFGE